MRPLEPEDRGLRLGGIDRLHIVVPKLARVHAELGGHSFDLANGIEGIFDIFGGKGLAVVPLHVLPERKG